MKPRITVHKNGNATLSGIPINDLLSILTAARLYRYDHKFQPSQSDYSDLTDVIAHNNRSGEQWHRRQEWILDFLSRERDEAHRKQWRKPLGLKEQLRENNKERQLINDVIENFLTRR